MPRTADRIFEHIRALADQNADVDQFVQAFHELVSVMKMAMGSVIEPGQILYRATKYHKAIPRHISEISYPPVERVIDLGRCNRIGQAVFYCSSDQNCVLEEIGPSVGDLVVRATWKTTERMFLQDIGYTGEVLANAGASRSLPEKYHKFVSTLTDDARRIRDYIAAAFTDRTSKNYALTTAIAEVHLRSDDIVGIMYPSITRKANSDNLALQPHFVKRGMQLTAAEALRVRVWNDTSPDAYAVADLAGVQEDGTLVWSYSGTENTTIAPKEATGMWLKPGERLTVQGDAEIELNGQRYVLRKGFTLQLEGDAVTVRDGDGILVSPQ